MLVYSIALPFGVVLLMSGCGNNSDEQRIAELEAEVERLQNEQNATNDQASGDAA